MRSEVTEAIDALRRGLGEPWRGKTFRQFWDWFNTEDDRIVAMAADEAEAEAIRADLLEVRAATHLDVPDERLDEVIGGPGAARDQLDARIAALRAHMPEILAMEEKDQMDAFAGVADEILEDAGGDRDHVWSQLQCILRDAGLVPGDDEPCDRT